MRIFTDGPAACRTYPLCHEFRRFDRLPGLARGCAAALCVFGLAATSVCAELITPAGVVASSSYPGREPANLIDGSGLTGATDDAGGAHVASGVGLWHAADHAVVSKQWLIFSLNRDACLTRAFIWNYNTATPGEGGRGVKDFRILVSTRDRGRNFTLVGQYRLAQAPGTDPTGSPHTGGELAQGIVLPGVKARRVKFEIINCWSGKESEYVGLSEVRFGGEPCAETSEADVQSPGQAARTTPAAPFYFLQPGDVVLFLGNSITDFAKPEMEYLVGDFRKQYPALAAGAGSVKLITSGVGGEPASEGILRVKRLLALYKPTVCVVGYGTCEMTFEEQSGYPAALKGIVRQLKAANVAVTLVSPPPVSPANWKQAAWPAERFTKGLPVLVEQARKVAAEEGVLFVDAYRALSEAAEADDMELTVDGIHLNQDGYRVMADALQAVWGFGAPLLPSGSPRAQGPSAK